MRAELRRRLEDPRERRARHIERLMDDARELWVARQLRELCESNRDWLVYLRRLILGLRPRGWRALPRGGCDVCAESLEATWTPALGLRCPRGHAVHLRCLALVGEQPPDARCPICLRL
jgi:hypothetical protein